MCSKRPEGIAEIEKRLKRALSPSALGIGVLNMVNHTALILALVFLALGWLIDYFYWIGGLIAVLGRRVLKSQLVSRIKHVRKLSALKFEQGELTVYDKDGLHHSWRLIAKIRKKEYLYCDPWRPITVGYPGIEISLDGQNEPVEHLCAYGMEEDRDELYELLQKYLLKRKQRKPAS
jgi:hypothetical protein